MYFDPKGFYERTGSLDEAAIWLADAFEKRWFWKALSIEPSEATTLALFIKHLFREFISIGRKDYTLEQVADIENDIVERSGRGEYTVHGEYFPCDTNDFRLLLWCWVITVNFPEMVNDLKEAIEMWRRHDDGSARCGYERRFFVKEVQRSERGRRGKYVVVEEWYGVVDKSSLITRYDDKQQFEAGCFACENEAHFFIAELVMKLNDPWIQRTMESLEKIHRKIKECAEAATQTPYAENEVYRQVSEEIDRRRPLSLQLKPKKKTKAVQEQCVYVLKTNFDTVKIGISQNVDQRKTAIERENDLKVVQWCCTAPVPQAAQIEGECHEHFATHALGGEFFNVSYEEARDYLATHKPIVRETKE